MLGSGNYIYFKSIDKNVSGKNFEEFKKYPTLEALRV